jgi:hypothetical protein
MKDLLKFVSGNNITFPLNEWIMIDDSQKVEIMFYEYDTAEEKGVWYYLRVNGIECAVLQSFKLVAIGEN